MDVFRRPEDTPAIADEAVTIGAKRDERVHRRHARLSEGSQEEQLKSTILKSSSVDSVRLPTG